MYNKGSYKFYQKKRSLISLLFLSNKQTFYTLKENDKSCIYETPYAIKNPSIPEFDGWMMLPRKALKHKNCVTNYIPFYFTGVIQILSYILSLHITSTIVIFKIYMMGIKILEYTVFSMGGC